jgi:hypothetical protein
LIQSVQGQTIRRGVIVLLLVSHSLLNLLLSNSLNFPLFLGKGMARILVCKTDKAFRKRDNEAETCRDQQRLKESPA